MIGKQHIHKFGLAPQPVFGLAVFKRAVLSIALGCAVIAPAYAESSSLPSYSERWLSYPDQVKSTSSSSLTDTILTSHNDERARWNVPPLNWDEGLAADAKAYANDLARKGYLQHDDQTGSSEPQGENLWMGTRNAFGYDQMMDGFLEERRHYVAKALPNISKTGNWADAGHYSQIIWRTTKSVGCATASSRDYDFLVCRYWPAGNVWGMRADDGGPSMRAAFNEERTYSGERVRDVQARDRRNRRDDRRSMLLSAN